MACSGTALLYFYLLAKYCGYDTLIEVPKMWGTPPGGAVGRLGCEMFVKGTLFILKEIWVQDRIFRYAVCLSEKFYLPLSTGTGSEL
jgi:hypothetical protein